MAELASSLVTALGRRIRDPNSTAHASGSVITLLSHIQRCVNAMTGAVKVSTDVTVSTTSVHAFTDMTSSLTTHVRVERVLYQNDDVLHCAWTKYAHIDPYWTRRAGSRPLMWDMVGRGLFVVTPSLPGLGGTVTALGTKLTTALTIGSSATELPDEHMPAILAMGEQLLLIRQRLLASVKPAVEQFNKILPTGIP